MRIDDIQIQNSGVTAGTYGDSTHVVQLTVNAEGIITGATLVAISGGGGGGGGVSIVTSLPAVSSSNRGNLYLLDGSGTVDDKLYTLIKNKLAQYQYNRIALSPVYTVPSGSNVICHLTAESLGLTDGTIVTAWNDVESNNNFSQSNYYNQPVFKTAVLNGYPVVRFSGTPMAANSQILPLSNFSLFVVCSASSSNTSGGRVFGFENAGSGSNGVALLPITGSAENFWVIRNSGTAYDIDMRSYQTFSTGTFHLHELIMGSGGSAAYVNGAARGTSTATAWSSASENAHVGGAGDGSQAYIGDIAEVIIYNTALSTTNRQAVETYFSQKYGFF